MRFVRSLLAVTLASALVSIVACKEPTQVTIDVRLATAKCDEVHGTAITVGVRPSDTEDKVKSRFPTAQTTDCDPATNQIGTLVITPSDDERASIIVIASYGNRRDPTECQPPDYKDCIVARRQFSFSKNRRMSMPITIDPTCVNVPCDAFSTCRKGFCFSAEAAPCEGDGDCIEPGETANGGTDPDAAVEVGRPDANPQDDSGPPLMTDSGGGATDAAEDVVTDTGTGSDANAGMDAGMDAGSDAGSDAASDASSDASSDADADTGVDSDAGSDGDADAGMGGQSLRCEGGRVVCEPACMQDEACCGSPGQTNNLTCVDVTTGAKCPNVRFCCADADCGTGERCMPGDGNTVGQCCSETEGGAMPTCSAML